MLVYNNDYTSKFKIPSVNPNASIQSRNLLTVYTFSFFCNIHGRISSYITCVDIDYQNFEFRLHLWFTSQSAIVKSCRDAFLYSWVESVQSKG